MVRSHRTQIALLAALGLAAGLMLLRPDTLWAQGTQPKIFLALASGSQETPAVDTPAVGFGRFVLFSDRRLLFYEIRVSGLKAPFTGMHLHRGRAGQGGPVVYPLSAPVGGTSIGVVDFNPADEAELMNQGFYLNIHSEAHTGGEIRSQVMLSPGGALPQVNP